MRGGFSRTLHALVRLRLDQGRKDSMTLTVILRNDSPMIHCGDSPLYRSVQIDLTPEQCAVIAPRKTGSSAGVDEYESISKAFIEPDKNDN